jgi:hypothetical protein
MIATLENGTIILYLVIAAFITIKLGAVLYKTGAVLLFYVFSDQKEWAKPVNNILLCGFYLVNSGVAALYFRQGLSLNSYLEAFEFLSFKLGGLLLLTGGMHLFNVIFFLVVKWKYLMPQTKTDT